jgi:hypothetical protein
MNTIEQKANDILTAVLAVGAYHFGYLMAAIVLYDALEVYLGWSQPTLGNLVFYAVMFVLLQWMRATERGMEREQ